MQWIHSVPLSMSLHCIPVIKTILPKPFQDATLLALSVCQSLLFTGAVLGAPRPGGGKDSHRQAGDKQWCHSSPSSPSFSVYHMEFFLKKNCNVKCSPFVTVVYFTPGPSSSEFASELHGGLCNQTWKLRPPSSSLVCLKMRVFVLITKHMVRQLDCPRQTAVECLGVFLNLQ